MPTSRTTACAGPASAAAAWAIAVLAISVLHVALVKERFGGSVSLPLRGRVDHRATMRPLNDAAQIQFRKVAPHGHFGNAEQCRQRRRRHKAALANELRDAFLAHPTDEPATAGWGPCRGVSVIELSR